MKKETLSKIISGIDEKYVEEASASENKNEAIVKPRKSRRFKAALAAAAVVLAAVIGFSAFAIAAEAKEYKEAVEFFEQNGLSTEGLSRSEIKEIYRDISTERFEFGKTKEVILNSVPGLEITQDEPTPEELAELWNNRFELDSISGKGYSYKKDYNYVKNEEGSNVLESCVLDCYKDGEKIWSHDFGDFYISNQARLKDGTAVWGYKEDGSETYYRYEWLYFIDDEGKEVWKKDNYHGSHIEYIVKALPFDEDCVAVISRSESKYLCLSYIGSDGKETYRHETEIGIVGVRNAARLGDGFIVQLGGGTERDTALLYKMDRDGNLLDRITFKEDEKEYYLTDMTEYGGKVFLSGYSVPDQSDGTLSGGRYEIENILDYTLKIGPEITPEQLTPVVRDNYTAVLLICDAESVAPQAFYSVKGSIGGKLAIGNDNTLDWNVNGITSSYLSMATSSFTIGSVCKVFRYTFDSNGKLINTEDTGEIVQYRK